jgi:arabinofuranosyltransferase
MFAPHPRRVALAALPGALVLGLHAWAYLPFIADDALISLRYADRLIQGKGLTWTDGERVEGYSNLLHVLLCAALGALGVDLIDAARVVGLVGALVAVGAVAARANTATPSLLLATVPPLLVGLAAPVAVWVVGGLEQGLLAGLLAAALVASASLLDVQPDRLPRGGHRRAAWCAGAFLAALCWTRPDGPLHTALVAAALLAVRRDRTMFVSVGVLATLPTLAVLAQLAFRLTYYGDWVPNTAYAKLAFTPERVVLGATYVRDALLAAWPMVLLAAPALLACRDPARRGRVALSGTVLVGWLGYVTLIGGDIFPAWRHFGPAVPCFALLAAEGLGHLAERVAVARVGTLAFALAAALGGVQWRDPENQRAREERWEWEGQAVGRALQTAFGARAPLVGVVAAGTIPYFSKLPALDLLGLNDRWIATHPPASFGTGRLGHELGDPDYVHDRAPDLIVFGSARGMEKAGSALGRGIQKDPRFKQNYRVVQLRTHAGGVRTWLWARATSARIGVERAADAVRVPGFLFATDAAHPATLAQGRLGVRVDHVPVEWRGFELGAGAWTVDVEADGDPVLIGVGAEAAQVPPFAVTTPRLVDVRVLALGRAHVREVRFTKRVR